MSIWRCGSLLRFNHIWLILIVLAGVFGLLYLWFSLFPGRINPDVLQYFSPDQVARGRQYNRIPNLLSAGSFLAQAVFLIWLVFGGRAVSMSRWAQQAAGGSYWGGVLLFFVVLWLLLRLLNLPFTLSSSYFWQQHWGFSTQSLGSWWVDYLQGAGLDLVISAVGAVLLFWAMGRWPGTWWLAGALFVSVWLIVQSLIWPVVVSPLFNRFDPAGDPELVAMVQELSQKARLPVDQVLIMDASRRTTRANAYFAGVGQTRRIVLYDTLLADYPPDEVKAVVAHEMAHWRLGHIMRGLAWGILGNIVFWGALFLTLRMTLPTYLRYPPHTWAVILLFFLLVGFAGNPLQNYLSRGMEKEADRMAVDLTGDSAGAVHLQVDLAGRNLSDVAPAPFVEWFSYSHPPAVQRINDILQYDRQQPWPE
ncbi:MAG TPA: endopeptidase [Pelotomaculum sp.]|nr:endopeptidase [Pelotomaculum sp.]